MDDKKTWLESLRSEAHWRMASDPTFARSIPDTPVCPDGLTPLQRVAWAIERYRQLTPEQRAAPIYSGPIPPELDQADD